MATVSIGIIAEPNAFFEAFRPEWEKTRPELYGDAAEDPRIEFVEGRNGFVSLFPDLATCWVETGIQVCVVLLGDPRGVVVDVLAGDEDAAMARATERMRKFVHEHPIRGVTEADLRLIWSVVDDD